MCGPASLRVCVRAPLLSPDAVDLDSPFLGGFKQSAPSITLTSQYSVRSTFSLRLCVLCVFFALRVRRCSEACLITALVQALRRWPPAAAAALDDSCASVRVGVLFKKPPATLL